MNKFAGILNLVAGTLITGVGFFVIFWCGAFLCAAPREHVAMTVWAAIICTIGIYLVIGGLGRVRHGTVRLQERPRRYTNDDRTD